MAALSDVFKYISHFRHAGHQVGRKVGDMLEVLTYAAIVREPDLHSRLHVEPKLFGFSGAGHKVEFTLLRLPNPTLNHIAVVANGGEIRDPSTIFAFIECKKVGVEQTVNGSFKLAFQKHNNKSFKIPYETPISISFAPRALKAPIRYVAVISEAGVLNITKADDPKFLFSETLAADSRIIFTLSEDNRSEILGNFQSLREVNYRLNNCRILEIFSLEDKFAVGILNDCLPGPQTPEKAKQSSFVALDVRKLRYNSCDKVPGETGLISVLVITEFAHWEQKSLNMIRAYVDKSLVVSDAIIVTAFERFEASFGANFYNQITKDQFEKNQDVRRIALQVVNDFHGRIFLDIDSNQMVGFVYENGVLGFTSGVTSS